MTKSQIEVAKLLESKRAALAVESLRAAEVREAQRSNRAREAKDLAVLGETQRHNLQAEQVELGKLGETQRHARVAEGQAVAELSEKHRAALRTEELRSAELTESHRRSIVSESQRDAELTEKRRAAIATLEEQRRHAKVSERVDIGRAASEAAFRTAQVVLGEQQLGQKTTQEAAELAERARHNLAMELKDTAPKVTVTQTSPSQQQAPTSPKLITPKGVAINEQTEPTQRDEGFESQEGIRLNGKRYRQAFGGGWQVQLPNGTWRQVSDKEAAKLGL